MSTKTTNINEKETKAINNNFYAEMNYSYARADLPTQSILRNPKLKGDGAMAWLTLNLDLCAKQGFMTKVEVFETLNSWAESYMYPDDVQKFLAEMISFIIRKQFLWISPVENKYTTEFALKQTAKISYNKTLASLRGQKNGKTTEEKAAIDEKIDSLSMDNFIDMHRIKNVTRELDDWVNKAFEGNSSVVEHHEEQIVLESPVVDSNLKEIPANNIDPVVKAEENFKTAIQDVVINGGSAMDFVKSIVTPSVDPTYEPKTVLEVAQNIKNTDDIPDDIFPTAQELFNEPVNVLPEDYKLLDDETPTEISFEEPKVESRVWQAPTVPPEVQAKIDEQATPKTTTEDTDSEVVKKLKSWGLYQSQIKSILDATTPETLEAYIRMAETEGRNPGAYIMTLVKKGVDVSKYMKNTTEAPESVKVSKPVETPVVAPVEPKVEPQFNMNDLIHDNANDSYERYLAVFNAAFPNHVVGEGRRCEPLSELSWGAVKWESDIGVINNFLQGIMWLGDEYKAQKTLFGDSNVDAYGQSCPIAKLGDKRAVLDYFSVVHEAQIRGDFMKVLAEQKDKSEFARIMFEKYNGQ